MSVHAASDPIARFRDWQREAAAGVLSQPNAMCLSTVDADGVPHARFVDLKTVTADGFVFCTSHESPKAVQVDAASHVSLTFWWDHAGRQVRILGVPARITHAAADTFWAERGRDAQLASWSCEQSRPLSPGETLQDRVAGVRARFGDGVIPRPAHWGGYVVAPRRMEFLQFSPDRMHERTLYERRGGEWHVSVLQP